MVDHKIKSLLKLDYKILILSSFASKKIKLKNVHHYRIPSLSFFDFKNELKDSIANKELSKLIIFFPLVLTLGIIFDVLQLIFLKGAGGGKWFWAISAIPVSILIRYNHNFNILLTTGGPAGCHLAGIILSWLFKLKFIAYLQDPLVGSDIGRTSNSKYFLVLFEKLIIKNCTRIIFVTKTAAIEAKRRFKVKEYSKKIFGIYSGAIKHTFKVYKKQKNINKKLFLHAGTLYTSRNLDTLIKAFNYLSDKKKINLNKFELFNLGDIYGPMKKEYCKLPYFRNKKSTSRSNAIKKSLNSDILLLIQHVDNRSNTTIPFKTYEYLNMNKVIFALINNKELKKILTKRGHVCGQVKNYKDIADKLYYLINNFKRIEQDVKNCQSKILHLEQTKKILENI
jgi:glycosyltransferase involved in cell wall biosynthesis